MSMLPILLSLAGWMPLPPVAVQDAVPQSADEVASNRGSEAHRSWPQWRGPLGTGEAPHASPPIRWSETENIRWRVALPGLGHSTPIVWDDVIYVTTAVTTGAVLPPQIEKVDGAHDNLVVRQRRLFKVMALALDDGRTLWEETVVEALPHAGGHVSGSHASPSPVTDGKRLYASFGSYGVACLDLGGKILWQQDLGDMQTKHAHGEGSSPALHGDTLFLNWDHEGPSFLVALNKFNGEERWRVERAEVTSWSSPVVVDCGGQPQLIVSGTKRVRAYDVDSGDVIWECGGLSHNVVASPVPGDGMVFVASSYEKQSMLAIRLAGAAGDLTRSENLVWARRRMTSYVPTPLLYGGYLYFFHHYQNVFAQVEAISGKEHHGPFRLDQFGNVYASPVAANGRVYATSLNGTTVVLKHGTPPTPLARNELHDTFSASAAVVGDCLLLRGRKFLYCIAQDES